jgi:colanic acid biosynthesis glycosyl transferase WcaI
MVPRDARGPNHVRRDLALATGVKPLRVLLLTQHFPPEITAASFRLAPIAEAITARGHELEVVCPVPNHPSGIIEPGFRGRALVRQASGRLRVRYVWLATSPRKTLRTRLAAYGSYAFAAGVLGVLARRVDVVLASSPPLSVGAAGALAAARHRSPFVFDVRDLWPDSALDLGELGEGPMVDFARSLERGLYARADLVLTANRAFARTIEGRAGDTPVEVVPNGTTPEWMAAGEAEPDRAGLDMPADTFVWAYAGNIGLAHALDEAIEAAGHLGDGFRLVIIGAGPRRAALEERAAALPPGRVEFRDLMSPADAARHLRAADAVLIAERQAATVSAKLFDCCAIGRPIVAVCTGELERVIAERQVALKVPPSRPEALADAVRSLRDDPSGQAEMVARAREFAAEHLRGRQADRVADMLERLAPGPGR